MIARDFEDCQALGEVDLCPRGELRCRLLVTIDEVTEFFLSVICVARIEDVANVSGDLLTHFDFRCVMHRVLR